MSDEEDVREHEDEARRREAHAEAERADAERESETGHAEEDGVLPEEAEHESFAEPPEGAGPE
jgi:hypothetical protein